MKRIQISTLPLITLLLFGLACTDDNNATNNTSNNAKNNSNNAKRIACDAYTWCSSWEATREQPTTPELTGGTIQDGLYKIQEGTSTLEAYFFKGQRVLWIDGSSSYNLEGTWSVQDNVLTMNLTQTCDENGTDTTDNPLFTMQYTVEGSNLYMRESDCSNNCDRRFVRVTSNAALCEEDQHVSCESFNCPCVIKQNSGFPESCY